MTLVVSIFLLLNQKMSLKSRLIIQESYSLSDISSGVRVVINVLIISFLIQFCMLSERTMISLTERLAQVFMLHFICGEAFLLMRWNTTIVS